MKTDLRNLRQHVEEKISMDWVGVGMYAFPAAAVGASIGAEGAPDGEKVERALKGALVGGGLGAGFGAGAQLLPKKLPDPDPFGLAAIDARIAGLERLDKRITQLKTLEGPRHPPGSPPATPGERFKNLEVPPANESAAAAPPVDLDDLFGPEKLSLDWDSVGRGLRHAGRHSLYTVPAGALIGMLTADKGHGGEGALRGAAIGAGLGLGSAQISSRMHRRGVAELQEAAARGIDLRKSQLHRFSTPAHVVQTLERHSPGFQAGVEKRIGELPLYPEARQESLMDHFMKQRTPERAMAHYDGDIEHLLAGKQAGEEAGLSPYAALLHGNRDLIEKIAMEKLAALYEGQGRNDADVYVTREQAREPVKNAPKAPPKMYAGPATNSLLAKLKALRGNVKKASPGT